MTDIQKLADGVMAALRTSLAKSLRPVLDRLEGVEKRVAIIPEGASWEQLRGEKGAPGDPGERGPAGEAGPAGAPGAPGPQGEKGEKGDVGERGEKGDAGAAGEVGARGEPGPQGEKGMPGDKGEKGDPGATGEPGPAGPQGEPGPVGPAGLAGEKGAPGDVGPAGPAGPQGEPGPMGPQGPAGPVGPAGEKGMPGERGAPGEPGPVGPTGPAGERGAKGDTGEPGRDGIEIEILDGISPTKRYHRNTYAAVRGGIVKSFRPTDLLPDGGDLEAAGWRVVVRGIDDVACQISEDARTLGLALRLTDGTVVDKQVSVPTMIYRGVWDQDASYARGDTVTRDGGTWILMADLQRGAPGESGVDTGWQLAVKKGRDGRDGLRGEKGERGAEGRPGRDLTRTGLDGRSYGA